ncbi:hypothetical protein GCM10010510_20990 [Streptomyces anandii JCM 4720]|nr:hypothetical protein GCM10010510_20990 [Streptomyces anandii JCM 4720]
MPPWSIDLAVWLMDIARQLAPSTAPVAERAGRKHDGGKADRAHRHGALTHIRQTGAGVPFAVAEAACTCARRSMESAAFPPVGSRQGVVHIQNMEMASAEAHAP